MKQLKEAELRGKVLELQYELKLQKEINDKLKQQIT